MRLIDADRLTPRCMFRGRCDSGGGSRCDKCTDYAVEYQDIKNAPTVPPERKTGRWIPITEIPPYGKDLMLKLHDRRRGCDCFFYYDMGFYDGDNYQTYLFNYQDDHDLEVVGWQLCPWEGEQE